MKPAGEFSFGGVHAVISRLQNRVIPLMRAVVANVDECAFFIVYLLLFIMCGSAENAT